MKTTHRSLLFTPLLLVIILLQPFELGAARSKAKKPLNSFDLSLLEGLNTLTFAPVTSQEFEFTLPSFSISELVETIHDNNETLITPLIVPIKDKNKEIKDYCIVTQGINIPHTHAKFITVLSKSYAEGTPSSIKRKKNFMQKIIDYVLPDYKDLADLPVHGGAALSMYVAFRDNLVHTPCIGFDYPDKELTNFAQIVDLYCLKNILETIPQTTKALYLGSGRGATTLLKHELLKQTSIHPAGMVLVSPFFSLKDIAKQISLKCRIKFPFLAQCAYKSFCWMHPNFNPEEDNLEELLTRSPIQDVPILIIHLKNDPMVSDEAMFTLVKLLSHRNSNVHLVVFDDPSKTIRHGHLYTIEKFQQAVNCFYRSYNLPHKNSLAAAGEQLFAKAKTNVYQAKSSQEWHIIPCFDKA